MAQAGELPPEILLLEILPIRRYAPGVVLLNDTGTASKPLVLGNRNIIGDTCCVHFDLDAMVEGSKRHRHALVFINDRETRGLLDLIVGPLGIVREVLAEDQARHF